jgi:hypothetical protein
MRKKRVDQLLAMTKPERGSVAQLNDPYRVPFATGTVKGIPLSEQGFQSLPSRPFQSVTLLDADDARQILWSL